MDAETEQSMEDLKTIPSLALIEKMEPLLRQLSNLKFLSSNARADLAIGYAAQIPEIERKALAISNEFRRRDESVGICGEIICCEHGVRDGDWCDPCNAEYKRAAKEQGHE